MAAASLFIVFTTEMTATNQALRVALDGFNTKAMQCPLLEMPRPPRSMRLIAGIVAGTTPTPFHRSANTGPLPAVVPATSPDRCCGATRMELVRNMQIESNSAQWWPELAQIGAFCAAVAGLGSAFTQTVSCALKS